MDVNEVEKELWRRFKVDRDLAARDFLLSKYSPWVRSIAASVVRRAGSRNLEWSDHVQNAHIGLLEAMSRYQPERSVPFQLYAKARIRGAVFNGIRQNARSVRSIDGYASVEKVEADNGLEYLPGFVSAIVEAALDYMVEQSTDCLYGDESVQGEQSRKLISNIIMGMPEKIRFVFINHYYLHKPFVKVAEELGLTKGRISQIHSSGLQMMRERLRGCGYIKDDFI